MWKRGIAIIAFLVILFVLLFPYRRMEGFSNMNITGSVEEEVIRTYNTILQRDPTIQELKSVTKDIQEQNMNFYTLRLLLVDSDEYQRMAKTQSNTVSPELLKMIAERDYLAKINQIYEEVFRKKIPSDLVLPYQDLYVHVFKNNDRLLKDMFLDDRYGTFENEILSAINLDRDQLFALYDRIYGMKEAAASSWMPVVPMDADIEKNKFRLAEGREIWYKGMPSAPDPQPFYLLPEGSLASSGLDWKVDDAAPGDLVIPPWRDRAQEEVTYRRFNPSGVSTVAGEPVEMTTPVFPSTVRTTPVTIGTPRTPQAPLQSEIGNLSLATSPAMLTAPPTSQRSGSGI